MQGTHPPLAHLGGLLKQYGHAEFVVYEQRPANSQPATA